MRRWLCPLCALRGPLVNGVASAAWRGHAGNTSDLRTRETMPGGFVPPPPPVGIMLGHSGNKRWKPAVEATAQQDIEAAKFAIRSLVPADRSWILIRDVHELLDPNTTKTVRRMYRRLDLFFDNFSKEFELDHTRKYVRIQLVPDLGHTGPAYRLLSRNEVRAMNQRRPPDEPCGPPRIPAQAGLRPPPHGAR